MVAKVIAALIGSAAATLGIEGYISGDEVQALVAALTTVATIVWAVYKRVQAKREKAGE